MHILKGKSTDAKNVLLEAAREHKSKVGNIDESKTYLNYNLAPTDNRIHNSEELKSRIKDLGVIRKIRQDAVCFYSIIVDLPKDYEGDQREFFESAYKNLTQLFCNGDEEKVLQAYVHLDEKTPHMHFASIPIVEKNNKICLSAKDITGSKKFMFEFHPKMQELMSMDLGQKINLYDKTKVDERQKKRSKGDRSADYVSIEQFKAEKQRIAYMGKLERYTHTLESQVQDQQQMIETLTQSIQGKKTDLGEAQEELNNLIAKGNEELKTAKLELTEVRENTAKYRPLQKLISHIQMMVKRLESVLGITKYLSDPDYSYLSTTFLNNKTGEWEKHDFPFDHPEEVQALVEGFRGIEKEIEELDLED